MKKEIIIQLQGSDITNITTTSILRYVQFEFGIQKLIPLNLGKTSDNTFLKIFRDDNI